MIRLILILTLLSMSLVVNSQTAPSQLFEKLTYTNATSSLPYRLMKPATNTVNSYPLIVFLHGAGERGNDNEAQLKHIVDLFTNQSNREQYPCFVVAPQCPAKLWWAEHNKDGSMKSQPTSTMQLVIKLIEKIANEYNVDPSRIYITGVSMGGYGVWDLLARYPNKFAAAVPICGGADPTIAPMIKHVPQWVFHGAMDRIVHPNQSRRMVAAMKKFGGTPTYTEYPNTAHDSWVPAYREPMLIPWLFNQKLKANGPINN